MSWIDQMLLGFYGHEIIVTLMWGCVVVGLAGLWRMAKED